MEYGSVERAIHVDAEPEVVYEVISTAEHLRQRWPDEAELAPVAATGRWGSFLMSLKQLVETGTGAPAPHDAQISNWH